MNTYTCTIYRKRTRVALDIDRICGATWRLRFQSKPLKYASLLIYFSSFIQMELFFHPIFTKLETLIHRTKAQKVVDGFRAEIINEFFKNYFHFFEVYFRSPFGHLPVTFAQTLIVSSPIFSANLEPLRARLRCVLSKIACFSPPTSTTARMLGRCGD